MSRHPSASPREKSRHPELLPPPRALELRYRFGDHLDIPSTRSPRTRSRPQTISLETPQDPPAPPACRLERNRNSRAAKPLRFPDRPGGNYIPALSVLAG